MLNILAEIACNINGRSFTIGAKIAVAPGAGKARAVLEFDRLEMPPGFTPELLSFAAITGYPAASFCHTGAYNPFAYEPGDFRVERELNLGLHGRLVASCASSGRKTPDEELIFTVSGSVAVFSQIAGIKPTFELWEPLHADGFCGNMAFDWTMHDGTSLKGRVASTYHLPGGALEKAQVRAIGFELERTPTHFVQAERIDLYDLEHWRGNTAALVSNAHTSAARLRAVAGARR